MTSAVRRGSDGSTSRRALAVFCLASLLACAGQDEAVAKKREKADGGKGAGRAAATCKTPAAVDPDLAQGLALHLAGKSAEAIPKLEAWSARPDAASDPAAGRGYYSLAFALRARGTQEQLKEASDKALVALNASLAEKPTLETYYYLASLHQNVGDTAAQLGVVAAGLREFEAGTLCPKPDGDDLFRVSRLAGFAGRTEQQADLLARAAVEYQAGRGSLAAYRALVHTELATAARAVGDLGGWEASLRLAAEADTNIPGVHRGLGLALIAQDRVAEAADYWRQHWRDERDNGNALVYGVRVLDDIVSYRAKFGAAERIANLTDHTVQALEQNALLEGRSVIELAQARETAEGGKLDEKQEADYARADYRMNQFLLEYLSRGNDLQEFALQKGLLPAINHRSLPAGR